MDKEPNSTTAKVHQCQTGLRDPNGLLFKKTKRLDTHSQTMTDHLDKLRCNHDANMHQQIEGSVKTKSCFKARSTFAGA